MKDAETAKEIGHDAKEGEKLVEARVRSFEHDAIGVFRRRG